MGVAAMLAPRGLGLQDPTKKLAHQVKLLGQSLSQKNVFQNFGPEPPPLRDRQTVTLITSHGLVRKIVLGNKIFEKPLIQYLSVQKVIT